MSMNNQQQLKSLLSPNYPISDEFVNSQLAMSGLNPEDDYMPSNAFDYAIYMSCVFLLGGVNKISESGYTIEMNVEGLKYLLKFYANKWGWEDITSTLGQIKNATNKW